MPIDACLVGTNILLRMTRQSDPEHGLVKNSLAGLVSQRTLLFFKHQNISELWNAMTRPRERNGLGLDIGEAERQVEAIERGMSLLPDNEGVNGKWRRPEMQYAVNGVQLKISHDFRV
jgi:hypothetical protein